MRYAHCSRGFWEQTHSGPGTKIDNGRPFFSRGCRPKCKQKYRESEGLYAAACAAAGDEEEGGPLFATPDEGFGTDEDDEGKKVKIKK